MNSPQQGAIVVAIDLQQYVFWLQHRMIDRAVTQNAHESARQLEADSTLEQWMSRRQF